MKEIDLNTGDKCQVSDEDYEYLNQWSWQVNQNNGEIQRTQKGCIIKMIFIIAERMQLLHPNEIDHKDRNRLNNQRTNLRAATRSENQCNTAAHSDNPTGLKGVHFDSENQKYRSTIMIQGRRIHLGRFLSEIEAAKAYDRAARRFHGEFAVLNFSEQT